MNNIKEIINLPRPVNPTLQHFVDDYENNKNRDVKPNDKIRYFFSKRNLTFGEAEFILDLPGGSISSAAHQKLETVDQVLSQVMGVPIDELRLKPKKKRVPSIAEREENLKNVIKKLRKLADDLENHSQ